MEENQNRNMLIKQNQISFPHFMSSNMLEYNSHNLAD